jgi:hypothetical protein
VAGVVATRLIRRMAQLNHRQYDALERAVTDGRRIAIYRRGTEYLVVPTRLRLAGGREAVDAVHPTTGERITLWLDEVDSIEVVR